MRPELLADHGGAHVEAEVVLLDPRNDVEDFMAVLVESDRLGGIACQGLRVIISFSPFITPGTTETSYSVPWKLTRSLLVTLRLSGSAIANWRHTSTLGASPTGAHGCASRPPSGSSHGGSVLRGVEPRAPGLGGSVQFVQIGDRLEAQSRLELALDEVPGVLHLASHPRGTGLVNDDADAQRTAKVPAMAEVLAEPGSIIRIFGTPCRMSLPPRSCMASISTSHRFSPLSAP